MMSKSACSTVNKDAVATAFSKAVNSYDKFAGFQRDVGTHLLHLLEAELPWNKTGYKNSAETTVNVLDLGCGTGYLSAQLAQNNAALGLNAIAATVNIIAVDIALAMAQRAQSHASHIHALVADADQLAFADNSLDLAFSSLALQWCDQLAQPITELQRVVKGYVGFSTLLDGSLIELGDSWEQVDGRRRINPFLSRRQVEAALHSAGVHHYRIAERTHRLYFADPKSVMLQLKGVGANTVYSAPSPANVADATQGLGGSDKLKSLYRNYEQRRLPQGIPATYQVCYVIFDTTKQG